MASIQVQELPTPGVLGAGLSQTIVWKNPPKRVVGFWASPSELGEPFIFPGKMTLQVTKVESIMDQANHFRLEVTVKNSSAVEVYYALYMYYLG